MWATGITHGMAVNFFSAVTFSIAVTHSFFWNKFLAFKSGAAARREYVRFFAVSTVNALINLGIVSLLVNGVGAPSVVSEKLWANFALLCTVPVSVLGNFFGYLFLVFNKGRQLRPSGEGKCNSWYRRL